MHLQHRFGLSPHGLAAYPELGLGSVSSEQVQRWAATRFTSGNAALWLTGPPPGGFRLALPDGPRIPAPAVEPIPHIRWPAHVELEEPGVGLGFVVPRRGARALPPDIVVREKFNADYFD